MSKDRHPGGRTPEQTAALLGLVMLAAIFATLLIFLVIAWVIGDPTNNLEERQPTDAPGGSATLERDMPAP